nr:MAG TPA: Protein of unknown function (DUF1700) [Caudoviricetes sp.]
MTMNEYLTKLKKIYNSIPQKFEQEIFYILCKQFQNYITGQVRTKYVTKESIIRHLITKGLMQWSYDKETHEQKLPDDRPIRRSVRILMRNGLPILSSSTSAGYYICDNLKEIEQPMNENKKRALAILSRQKGFEIMQNFINGQIDITEINLNLEEDLEN